MPDLIVFAICLFDLKVMQKKTDLISVCMQTSCILTLWDCLIQSHPTQCNNVI